MAAGLLFGAATPYFYYIKSVDWCVEEFYST